MTTVSEQIIDWTPDWFLGSVTVVVLVVIVATTVRWFNDTKEKSLISIDEDGKTPEWFTLRMIQHELGVIRRTLGFLTLIVSSAAIGYLLSKLPS